MYEYIITLNVDILSKMSGFIVSNVNNRFWFDIIGPWCACIKQIVNLVNNSVWKLLFNNLGSISKISQAAEYGSNNKVSSKSLKKQKKNHQI